MIPSTRSSAYSNLKTLILVRRPRQDSPHIECGSNFLFGPDSSEKSRDCKSITTVRSRDLHAIAISASHNSTSSSHRITASMQGPESQTGSNPAPIEGEESHLSQRQGSTLFISEAVEDVFEQTEVTVDGLRTLYAEILAHVENACSGEVAIEALFQRCRTDFELLADGRFTELSESLERIRGIVYRLEHRLDLLEKVQLRKNTRRPSISDGTRTPPAPSRDAPWQNPIIRPMHLPPSPQRGAPIPFNLGPRGPEQASPRVNPAVFDMHHRQPQQASTPARQGAAFEAETQWFYGALEPGLEPLTTLLPEFRRVIDYRTYRLRNTSLIDNQGTLFGGSATKLVNRVRHLMPRMADFDGRQPLDVLRFLRDFRQAADGIKLTEGGAVRAVSWFLDKDALRTYSLFAFSGVRRTDDTDATWPRVVNALLERYLTDEILGDAYSKVTTATQEPNEGESRFLERIESYADECCGVFDDYLLVNYFLRGLHDTIRPIVSQRVSELPTERRTKLNTIRRLAQAEGDAYRARLRATEATPPPSTPVPRGTTRRTSASTASTLLIRPPPESIGEVVAPVMAISPHTPASTATAESVDDTLDISNRIESFLPSRIPTLNAEQIAMAQSIIPKDSDWHICWLCREAGHTLYSCTYLTPEQRLYAAYQNFRYQCETRPNMRNLLEQKAREHLDGNGRTLEGKSPNPPSQGPTYNANRPPTILRRPGSSNYSGRYQARRSTPGRGSPYQSRMSPNVRNAVMTIQQHLDVNDSSDFNELLAQLHTPVAIEAATETVPPAPGIDPPVPATNVQFTEPSRARQLNDQSSTDSDESKNE